MWAQGFHLMASSFFERQLDVGDALTNGPITVSERSLGRTVQRNCEGDDRPFTLFPIAISPSSAIYLVLNRPAFSRFMVQKGVGKERVYFVEKN